MKSSGTVNYAAKEKKETFDMCCDDGYDDMKGQASDTEKFQYLRCLQESTIRTLEEHRRIYEFQSNQAIKIEFECKDVKSSINLLENGGIHIFQPKNEIETKFQCNDEKPYVSLSAPDEVNKEIHTFQHNQEIKVEFECKDVKSNVNLSVPDEVKDWSYRSHQSSIQIGTESIMKKKFLSDSITTFDTNTGCEFNGQSMIIYSPINKSTQSAECDTHLKGLFPKRSQQTHIGLTQNRINHPCQTCGKTFTYKSALKIHIEFEFDKVYSSSSHRDSELIPTKLHTILHSVALHKR
ncbi:uncharacterized protein LOC111694675 [Trichogramma pretiosum]|uniref:uncharacterized protein LOC111694675 n=1 Tax=Trichogramma pretiosum TaxID=7493 RepID=UPI000C719995|nr:uncharacterized protein LOC111694675 [Trichogramma pretiosum]